MNNTYTPSSVQFLGQCPPDFPNIQQQQPFQQPLSIQQQIALKELEKHGLETLLLQEQFKRNPFKLNFHYDAQTSTGDDFTPVETSTPRKISKKKCSCIGCL